MIGEKAPIECYAKCGKEEIGIYPVNISDGAIEKLKELGYKVTLKGNIPWFDCISDPYYLISWKKEDL
jgi:hypothetical protein